MKTRLIVLAALLSSTALAQPRPSPVFTSLTSFKQCSKSTMFACGMRDAHGNTYGTAKEVTQCTTYAFKPDGTYTTSWFEHGRYRVVGSRVTISPINDDGSPVKPFDMTLSADGSKLGDMKRL